MKFLNSFDGHVSSLVDLFVNHRSSDLKKFVPGGLLTKASLVSLLIAPLSIPFVGPLCTYYTLMYFMGKCFGNDVNLIEEKDYRAINIERIFWAIAVVCFSSIFIGGGLLILSSFILSSLSLCFCLSSAISVCIVPCINIHKIYKYGCLINEKQIPKIRAQLELANAERFLGGLVDIVKSLDARGIHFISTLSQDIEASGGDIRSMDTERLQQLAILQANIRKYNSLGVLGRVANSTFASYVKATFYLGIVSAGIYSFYANIFGTPQKLKDVTMSDDYYRYPMTWDTFVIKNIKNIKNIENMYIIFEDFPETSSAPSIGGIFSSFARLIKVNMAKLRTRDVKIESVILTDPFSQTLSMRSSSHPFAKITPSIDKLINPPSSFKITYEGRESTCELLQDLSTLKVDNPYFTFQDREGQTFAYECGELLPIRGGHIKIFQKIANITSTLALVATAVDLIKVGFNGGGIYKIGNIILTRALVNYVLGLTTSSVLSMLPTNYTLIIAIGLLQLDYCKVIV